MSPIIWRGNLVKSGAEKVRDTEARKRAKGLREIRVWVPDRDRFGPEDENEVRELAARKCAERTKVAKVQ